MKNERMYKGRKGNIPVFRGCDFHCVYCGFGKMLKLSSCPECKNFKPHTHIDTLNKRPPPTKEGEFLTIGLSSDISFAPDTTMQAIIHYCWLWAKHTFLIQSKNPACFLQYKFTDNVIIGTTLETNRLITDKSWGTVTCFYDKGDGGFEPISQAPSSSLRYEAMRLFNGRKSITIEPILDFDEEILLRWIKELNPEIVWVGYDSGNHRLPEPPLSKTQALIRELRASGIDVREKLIRKAWYE